MAIFYWALPASRFMHWTVVSRVSFFDNQTRCMPCLKVYLNSETHYRRLENRTFQHRRVGSCCSRYKNGNGRLKIWMEKSASMGGMKEERETTGCRPWKWSCLPATRSSGWEFSNVGRGNRHSICIRSLHSWKMGFNSRNEERANNRILQLISRWIFKGFPFSEFLRNLHNCKDKSNNVGG